MSTLTAGRRSPAPAPVADRAASLGRRVAAVTGVSALIVLVAALLPDWPAGQDMGSTHYMGLLAANQPWNLLLFMAVPVVLAETVAVTELVILFSRGAYRRVNLVNRYAGLVAGFYFLGVFSYLFVHAVVPLTGDGAWRGPADLVAVGFYLLGLVPLYGIALMETGVLGVGLDEDARRKMHAAFVGVFLVVAHVAMIFGMLDPGVLGWSPVHEMPGGGTMPGMSM
jgi:hypothetical protein